jgi:hypothetical protein
VSVLGVAAAEQHRSDDEKDRGVAGEHRELVIRYGQLWGPGTFYPDSPPPPPRIHIDDTTRQTLPALDVPAGVTIVADDRAGIGPTAR